MVRTHGRSRGAGLPLLVAAWLAGCGDKIDAMQETPPCTQLASGAVTYTDHLRPWFGLCTSCHSSALSGAARNGAPASANFDSYQGLVQFALEASQRIQNETMPPGSTKTTVTQKQLFECWIEGGKKER